MSGHNASAARHVLVNAERVLRRIYFYTSSIEKYLQARLVFARSGLSLDYYSATDPYDEHDAVRSTRDLLYHAVRQVRQKELGRGTLFFVEDTSVRIDALSSDTSDVPGVYVKDWFSQTSFRELDEMLRGAGDNRRAVVKSDIALSVPGLDRPIYVHGESSGLIANDPPAFKENPKYPWLTPQTFNGWFVPSGSDLPLGALSLEQSLEFDFRVRALEALVDRLEEVVAALNLPQSAFVRQKPRVATGDQPLFLPPTVLLIVGRTCAGKTTFAERAESQGFTRIEASEIVRKIGSDPLPDDDPGGFRFAMRTLDELGHDAVASQIGEQIRDSPEVPVVVSGLRDIEEIAYFKRTMPHARVVLIEASERTRFEREVRRGRVGASTRIDTFRERDEKQDAFGLLPIVDDLADITILNESSFEVYMQQIDAVVVGDSTEPGVDLFHRPRHSPQHHQLYRCLEALVDEGRALQCDEIEDITAKGGLLPIRHNNANKVLKAAASLATRIEGGETRGEEARVQYEATAAGQVFVALFRARFADEQS